MTKVFLTSELADSSKAHHAELTSAIGPVADVQNGSVYGVAVVVSNVLLGALSRCGRNQPL
jgi:hypothetical protein